MGIHHGPHILPIGLSISLEILMAIAIPTAAPDIVLSLIACITLSLFFLTLIFHKVYTMRLRCKDVAFPYSMSVSEKTFKISVKL